MHSFSEAAHCIPKQDEELNQEGMKGFLTSLCQWKQTVASFKSVWIIVSGTWSLDWRMRVTMKVNSFLPHSKLELSETLTWRPTQILSFHRTCQCRHCHQCCCIFCSLHSVVPILWMVCCWVRISAYPSYVTVGSFASFFILLMDFDIYFYFLLAPLHRDINGIFRR